MYESTSMVWCMVYGGIHGIGGCSCPVQLRGSGGFFSGCPVVLGELSCSRALVSRTDYTGIHHTI